MCKLTILLVFLWMQVNVFIGLLFIQGFFFVVVFLLSLIEFFMLFNPSTTSQPTLDFTSEANPRNRFLSFISRAGKATAMVVMGIRHTVMAVAAHIKL